MDKDIKKLKIGLMCICLNEQYWEYAKNMIETANKFFLKNHDVEYMLWSDMPDSYSYGATVFPTEPTTWPMPTLLRYHLFLREEEYLKKFDYIFYCDIDMLFVDHVGDEVLGEKLTAAQHPMYALRAGLYPPYEPNINSAAYIPRLGRYVVDNGQIKLEPLYLAGGFQGGETKSFIKAMHAMKRTVDEDFSKNYVAIWNDESHWNKYLFDNPSETSIVLSPSYIYPDSMIKEYYIPIWGRDYPPKLVTITKKFSLSKEGGKAVSNITKDLKNLK